MKKGLILLAGLAITIPLMMPGAIAENHANAETLPAPDDWEPWHDEDLIVRVPLEASLGEAYPEDWDGPRLVVHELDVNDVLVDAGWPTDRGQPVDFTLDPDSIRVVPQGVDDPAPLPALTWQGPLLSDRVGGPMVTLAFLAPPGVDTFHTYFDRAQNENDHEPVPRDPIQEQQILQLLMGPGSGHELVGPIKTNDGPATLAIGSPHEANILVEQRTPQGWSSVQCSQSTVTPTAWATCSLDTGGQFHSMRVTADKPVVAHAWTSVVDGGDDAGHHPLVPLASGQGTPEGTTLMAPNVRETTPVNLVSIEGTCEATAGSTTAQVGQDNPTSITIREDTAITADCPLIGWIPGRGPSPLPVAINDTLTKAGLASTDQSRNVGGNDCPIRQTVTAVGDERTQIVRIDTGEQDDDFRTLSRPSDATPHRLAHEELRAADWPQLSNAEGTGYLVLNQGNLAWSSLWDVYPGASQLAPTPTGSIGWIGPVADACESSWPDLRLASVPFHGDARVDFAAHGERIPPDVDNSQTIPVSRIISYDEEPSDADEIPTTGGLAETGLRGDLGLMASFTIVDEGDIVPATLASHLRPMTVDQGEADIIGPLFDLELDPSARIAGPGEVKTFTLQGEGQVLAPTGEVSPLEVNLNADAFTQTPGAPDIEHDLGEVQAELPFQGADSITTLTVTAPNNVPPETTPTYDLLVTGEPVNGGDTIPARATLQVVPDRELSLSFEDGNQIQNLATSDGEANTRLVLVNEGTTEEDVELSTILPGDLPWELTLTDPNTGEPFPNDVITGLQPGHEARIDFHVNVPDEAARVVDVTVLAQSLEDASVTSDAIARIAHGIEVNVNGLVDPDLVTLEPGQSQRVNLTLENQGSEVSVGISPDTEAAMILEPSQNRVNLGPQGTERANATVPLNLTAAPDAPIGTVVVGTIGLEVTVGEMDPIEQLLSLRLRVVPDHGISALDAVEILPGLTQSTSVSVRATGTADENPQLSLLSTPQGWTVEHPDRVSVPHNQTAPLPLNITTPEGVEPGAYGIAFRGLPEDGTDPITFNVDVIIPESPAFEVGLPTPAPLGVGATETYPVTITNRGNAPGDATFETNATLVDATPRPGSLPLSPGQQERIELDLTALSPGNDVVTFTVDQGDEATMPVEVGTVDLQLEVVSTSPSQPQQGEPYQALVSITNEGTVQARNVNVSLLSGQTPLHSETIARLNPQTPVTLTLAMNELPTAEALSVAADPEGVYEQDTPTDRHASLVPDEAPGPALAALLAVLGALAWAKRRP